MAQKFSNARRIRSSIGQMWSKIGLDVPTALTMFKGSIPPTIGIAVYQATPVSNHFGTVGYMIAVTSILCFCTMPRVQYVETLILNICGLCIECAVAFIGLVASVQARRHTEDPSQPDAYNSSASVVAAIFLLLNIFVINTLRAKYPSFQFPAILGSIYVDVVYTNMVVFLEVSQGATFIWRLTECFLIGFALATGVSFLILPLSSRTIVLKEEAAGFVALRKSIKTSLAYIKAASEDNTSNPLTAFGDTAAKFKTEEQPSKDGEREVMSLPEAQSFLPICQLFGKLRGDLAPASREIGWSKLDYNDLNDIFLLLRNVLLPSLGLSEIEHVMQTSLQSHDMYGTINKMITLQMKESLMSDKGSQVSQLNISERKEVEESLGSALDDMSRIIDAGLEHAAILLGLLPGSAAKKISPETKLEDGLTNIEPGMPHFAATLRNAISGFRDGRELRLKVWSEAMKKDLSYRSKFATSDSKPGESHHLGYTQQLFVVLYVEHLTLNCGIAVLELVQFADSKKSSGIMERNRLIWPALKHSRKQSSVVSRGDNSDISPKDGEDSPLLALLQQHDTDIEHMPPVNAWEKQSSHLRAIPKFFRSPEAHFGFRAVCASMTVGIAAFLRQSQQFFQEQRLVWAMVIIAIGMGFTSGQSAFGLIVRFLGTLVATINSIVIWYIVDGRTAGVITFLFVFNFVEFYFVIKFPRFVIIEVIAMITQVIILGYELQVRKIGLEAAEASGQPFLPIYELSPYRLACVAGGALVAFIWSIFPYPITERSKLREDLGASIYHLAEYYSCVHAGMAARFQGLEGDLNDDQSPGQILLRHEVALFAHEAALLGGLRERSSYTVWDANIGGKFPREKFDVIIKTVQNLMDHFALIAYGARSLPTSSEPKTIWLGNLSKLLKEINPTSHDITSSLVLLSSAVKNGTALPPYLESPKFYQISQRLEEIDPEILSVGHALEPGYASYAMLQVTLTLVSADLEKLITEVKALVGEIKFSSHINDRSWAATRVMSVI